MTNEQVGAMLNEMAGLLVPVAGTLVGVACREGKKHPTGCGCELCRAVLAVYDCQVRLESLARALTPARPPTTTPPPGYDCLAGD